MTGGGLLELILISMAWLFLLYGLLLNWHAWSQARRAGDAQAPPAGLGFVPGVAGSLAAFFTVPALSQYGVQVPWPWLWILLPLALDPYCLAGFLRLCVQRIKAK
jgi:hypothetical protein